jgi:ADP-heptose:LPS heptosyltransferase
LRSVQILQETVLEGVRRTLFRSVESAENHTEIKRIVVFRVGNVGDILVTIPLLSGLRCRFPRAYICLLTSPGQAGLPGAKNILPRHDWVVDEILSYDAADVRTWSGCRALLRRLRRDRFDLFVELPQTFTPFFRALRNLFLAKLSGVNSVAGIQMRHRMMFARAQALHHGWKRETDDLYDLVGQTLRLAPPQQVRLLLSDDDRHVITQRLAEFGIRGDTPFVAMQVGAKRATNRWFPERFAQVIDFLQQEYEVPVVLTGSTSDSAVVENVTNCMTTPVRSLVGRTTLLQTAALLERSLLYVGNDTGPMHLAAAVGTPTVSIFSGRDYPELWFPTGDGHFVLRSDVPCSPCFKETCNRNLLCLERIATSDVLDAVKRQLVDVALPVNEGQTRPP